ncbi:MAG TPA: phosphate ABC transporter substrate-binding protein [Methanothrix sp.]|nr:phosphate ABC transporter substrate-binding protein [Methanothrix sp.]
MMRVESKLLILLLVVFLAAAGGQGKEAKVSLSGSTNVMPLAELAAEEYNMLQDDYRVTVTSGGTGVGIVDVAEGRSDIAMASRELKLEEKQRYESPTIRFMVYPVGYDAICLVVSPDVYDGGVTSLTRAELRQIYAGDITNWMDVGGPDMEIFVIGRKPGSGTRDTFHEVVMGSKEAEAPGVIIESADSSEVKTAIQGSDNAIGYMGYSYVMRGDTKVLSLDGVYPSIENIKNGTYPIARKLYFVTLGDPSAGSRAFIDYVLSTEGQQIATENGFIPV